MAPTGRITLAVLYSAWAAAAEDIKEIFHFYPFGLPIASTVLRVGGTDLSQVWCGDRPIIVPRQICYGFSIKRRFSKIRRPGVDWGRNLGQNLGHFALRVKRGAAWVECLWIFYV